MPAGTTQCPFGTLLELPLSFGPPLRPLGPPLAYLDLLELFLDLPRTCAVLPLALATLPFAPSELPPFCCGRTVLSLAAQTSPC